MKKLTVALLGGCALTCLAMGSVIVPADAETIDPAIASMSRLDVVDGADLYLYTGETTDTETDNNGMRFRFEMSTELYELIVNTERTGFTANNEFSAMVVPTYLLETTEAATTKDVVNSSYTYTEVLSFDKWTLDTGITSVKNSDANGQVYYACAYLYNMPFYTYNVEYSACLRFISGGSTSYTNTVTRSMTTTAQNAIDSGDYASNATTTDLLNEYVVAENEINNFDFSNSLEFSGRNIWQAARNNYGYTAYLKEFEGRTGVVKLTDTRNATGVYVPAINFVPRQLKSAYEGYTHIVFSMYVNDPGNLVEWFNFFGNGTLGAQIPGSEIVRGAWKEYALPIDAFINNYDSFLQGSDTSYLAMRRKAGKPTYLDIFLDSIYVANMPTAEFETSLPEQLVGVEFTLPTATVGNANTVTYTLTKPDTSTETVTAGQAYTADTAGTYTLTVDVTTAAGLKASASMTFEVVAQSSGKHEINNYSTSAKADKTANQANYYNNVSYVETLAAFPERSGFMKLVHPTRNQWASIAFEPQLEKSAYENDTHIVISLYVEGANLAQIQFTQYWASNSALYAQADYVFSSIATGTWVDIEIPIAAFLDNFDAIANSTGVVDVAARMHFKATAKGQTYTLYIDEIYSYKKEDTAALSADVEESSTQTLESEASYVQASVVTAGADKRSLVYNV